MMSSSTAANRHHYHYHHHRHLTLQQPAGTGTAASDYSKKRLLDESNDNVNIVDKLRQNDCNFDNNGGYTNTNRNIKCGGTVTSRTTTYANDNDNDNVSSKNFLSISAASTTGSCKVYVSLIISL